MYVISLYIKTAVKNSVHEKCDNTLLVGILLSRKTIVIQMLFDTIYILFIATSAYTYGQINNQW